MRYKPLKCKKPWMWPSRLTEVECDGEIGLPMWNFLLVFTSNIWPNSAPLQESDLSSSLNVISNGAAGLLWITSYYCLIVALFSSFHSHVVCTGKFNWYNRITNHSLWQAKCWEREKKKEGSAFLFLVIFSWIYMWKVIYRKLFE